MSRISLLLTAASLAGVAASALPATAQTPSDFVWSKAMASGATLAIRNYDGRIDVHQSTSGRVEVRAVASSRDRIDDTRETILVDTVGDDVTICTVFRRDADDGRRRCRDRNSGGDYGRSARIDFTVMVPSNLQLQVTTGNGDLSVDRAGASVSAVTGNGDVTIGQTTGRVNATTGNGDVRVDQAGGPVKVASGNGRVHVATSSGPVTASTGNGPIDVSIKQITSASDMSFTSGSGSITVTLPADYNGEVDMISGTGSLTSDFPINIVGRLNPQHIRGTIGKGGPLLRLVTGSGSLELRKY